MMLFGREKGLWFYCSFWFDYYISRLNELPLAFEFPSIVGFW